MTARYARLFALPYARRLVAIEVPARLPIGLLGLAIVLFVREHVGSYGLAGLTAGAFALATGVSNPILGRMIDRRGMRPVLAPAWAAHSAGIVATVAAGLTGAPDAVVVAGAALTGAALPPLGPVTRVIWPELIAAGDEEPDLFGTALAVEGIVIELIFATGPLLAAAAAAWADPALALCASPLLLAAGLAGLLTLPAVTAWRPAPTAAGPGRFGPLHSRGLLVLMATMLPLGACFGAIEVTLPAFAEHHGDRALGGLLMASWSAGSVCGGFVYGALAWRLSLPSRWLRFALFMPTAYAALLLAGGIGPMAALAFVAGLAIAPLLTASNQIVAATSRPGTEIEAFVWPITTLVAGSAAGNALAGVLAAHAGARPALAGAAVAALLAAVIATAGHRVLTRDIAAAAAPA